MGAVPEMCKAYQNYIVSDIGYNIGGDIVFFSIFLTPSWHYDIVSDIVENYVLLHDIVADVVQKPFLAPRCEFFSRSSTGYRWFFTFYIGIYGHAVAYPSKFQCFTSVYTDIELCIYRCRMR